MRDGHTKVTPPVSSVVDPLLVEPGLMLGAYPGYIHEQGNVHIVALDRMCRLRQMDKADLIPYIKTYQIKSLVNLRGENTGSQW